MRTIIVAFLLFNSITSKLFPKLHNEQVSRARIDNKIEFIGREGNFRAVAGGFLGGMAMNLLKTTLIGFACLVRCNICDTTGAVSAAVAAAASPFD